MTEQILSRLLCGQSVSGQALSEELGVPMADLTKSGGGSRLLAGRTKEVLS